MRDEVKGPVIVPRIFLSVTRVLTHNMDKAVGNQSTVGFLFLWDSFFSSRKKKENKFSLCITSTSSHSRCPRQPYFMLHQYTRSVGVRLQHEVFSNWWEGLSRMENSLPVKKAVHFTLSFNLAEQLLAFFGEGEHVPWTKTVYNH